MAKITLTEAAGDYSFDVGNFSLSNATKYHSVGLSVLKYGASKNDYMELHGSFNYSHGTTAYDVVKSVTSLKLVDGGDTLLDASGLDILKADVKNNATLKAYLAGEAYTITGNGHSNLITTADKADKIYGNGGADTINGNGGADQLSGGTGIDHITGGKGNDILTGGTQNDIFHFASGDGTDQINDFDAIGRSHDSIDLSGYVGVTGFDDLDISRVKRDVHIDLPDGDTIVLHNVNIRDVDAGDFQF